MHAPSGTGTTIAWHGWPYGPASAEPGLLARSWNGFMASAPPSGSRPASAGTSRTRACLSATRCFSRQPDVPYGAMNQQPRLIGSLVGVAAAYFASLGIYELM